MVSPYLTSFITVHHTSDFDRVDWFTLMNKGKYSGEVYLELTFWSNVRDLFGLIR